jgi:hypothetical protein
MSTRPGLGKEADLLTDVALHFQFGDRSNHQNCLGRSQLSPSQVNLGQGITKPQGELVHYHWQLPGLATEMDGAFSTVIVLKLEGEGTIGKPTGTDPPLEGDR